MISTKLLSLCFLLFSLWSHCFQMYYELRLLSMLPTIVLLLIDFFTAPLCITITDHWWVMFSCAVYYTSLCSNPHHPPAFPLSSLLLFLQTASLRYSCKYLVLHIITTYYRYLYKIMLVLYNAFKTK